MDDNLISICIPCYEMGGKGSNRLQQLLRSICYQSYTNYEIIVSDHSTNTDIENVCNGFEFEKLNIQHFYNDYKRGSSSANVNTAIKKSNGSIIKIMFQDDYFIDMNALNRILERDFKWGVCGCVHSKEDDNMFYNRLVPVWQDRIKEGVNTLGGPSCLYYKRCDIEFDEDLLWFMDTDFFYRMYQKFGKPDIIADPLYCSRESSSSVSSTLITDELVKRETKIIKERYGF
jgi:glycosyltransferase involved in cell wall biosynthesis